MPPEVPSSALIIGTGLMGSQIAVEFAQAGLDVLCISRDVRRCRDRVNVAFALWKSSRRHPSYQSPEEASRRISYHRSGERLDSGYDLIYESLPEDFTIKVETLRPLIADVNPRLIASNTSSLSLTELGREVGASSRLVGMHFMNPALLMPLVEVTPGEATAVEAVRSVVELVRRCGKTPIELAFEIPGFAWNRLQFALLREAVHLVESGVANAETVDRVVQEGLGRRWSTMGPLRSALAGGIEVFERSAAAILPDLSLATDLDGLSRAVADLEPESEAIERRDERLAEELGR